MSSFRSSFFHDASGRSRPWCWTLNNPTVAEKEAVITRSREAINDGTLRYLVYGEEVGESGTPHLQGFLQFANACGMRSVKDLVSARCDCSKARLPLQAIEYCKKDGVFFEEGTPPAYSGRTAAATEAARTKAEERAADLLVMIKNRVPYSVIAEKYPAHFFNGASRISSLATLLIEPPPDSCEVDCVWYYGVSGIGKSKRAHFECGLSPTGYYLKDPGTKWWCGYRGEGVILIDDVDPAHADALKYHMKQWGGNFSFHAEFKGGGMKIRPRKIVVTSQYSIYEVFSRVDPKCLAAMERRFREVEMTVSWETPTPPPTPPPTPLIPSPQTAVCGGVSVVGTPRESPLPLSPFHLSDWEHPTPLTSLYCGETLLDEEGDYPVGNDPTRLAYTEPLPPLGKRVDRAWSDDDEEGLSETELRERKRRGKMERIE